MSMNLHSQRIDLAKSIKDEYSTSIVKVMLYDPAFEKEFKLTKGKWIWSTGAGVMVHESGVVFTNRHNIDRAIKGYLIADVYYNETKTRTLPKQFLTYEKGMELDEKYKKVYYIGHPLIFIQVYTELGSSKVYIAEVVSYSETFDGGAILKIVKDVNGVPISEPNFKSVKIGNSNNVQVRDDIIIAGYKNPSQKHITASMKAAVSIGSADIMGMNYSYQKNFHYFTSPLKLNSAMNGGPVFDMKNNLIGISVVNPTSNKSYIAGVNTLDYLARVDDEISSKLTTKGLSSPKKIGNLSFDVGSKWEIPDKETFVGNKKLAENFKQVVGQLKSVDSGQPISNGIIGLFEYDASTKKMSPKALGRTDSTGAFKLKPAVPFKEYFLMVKADGFKPIRKKKAITLIEYELDIDLEKVE